MKKIIPILLSTLFLVNCLCSCKMTIKNATDDSCGSDLSFSEQEEDYYDYHTHNADRVCDFLETADGYYLLNYKNKLIYYSEKGNLDFVVLCNKPDCNHSGEECNAYAGTHIGYYNGKIYCVKTSIASSTGAELIRMNTDGTNHEKVADMPFVQSQNGVGQHSGGGRMYYYKGCIINFINLSVDTKTSYPVVYKVELETGKSTLLLEDELKECTSSITSFYPCDNKIWFQVCLRQQKDHYFYCVDLDTCEISEKIKIDSDLYIAGVKDGLLYYYKSNTGFCEYNPETEEEKLLKQYDYTMANVVYGDEYIFAKVWKLKDDGKDRDSWMIMMDKSYNIIAQAELQTDAVTNMAFISVTSDYIFLYEGNDAPTGITHFIDLNKITDGKMTVEKIQ